LNSKLATELSGVPFFFPVLVAEYTGTATPAGGCLKCLDVWPIGFEDMPRTFKAGMLVVGYSGNQIEPVLKTFHNGNSFGYR
jgi:hypothetical protein